MSAEPSGISIREFARRDGCNDKLVRRAIEAGRLTKLANGLLDPAAVGTGWRETNRRADTSADSDADTGADLLRTADNTARSQIADADAVRAPSHLTVDAAAAAAAERLVRKSPLLSLGQAERLKENFVARLRELEYDLKSGAVVPVVEVERLVTEEYARVRTRLLAIPSELAPRIHRLKTLPEIQAALTEAVVEALEELTRDGAPAAG